jgi:hypothetical protein
LAGKVFISAGTNLPQEKDAVQKVKTLLESAEFNLQTYVAINVQSLGDIMNITTELRDADYYLFIDFKRHSTFTHQELALAHHLGYGGNIIALQENDAALTGFLRYVQSNPETFANTTELLEKLKTLVKTKGWISTYSRNLVLDSSLRRSGLFTYGDHTGQALMEVWHARIENRRNDAAAVGAVCMLDSIRFPSGTIQPCGDHGYLKWAGHRDYERTILPKTSEEVALCAIRPETPGLFLLSTRDSIPREAIVTDNGRYELNYKVFARDFPLLEFTVTFDLRWHAPTPVNWQNDSEASLHSSRSDA